MNKARVEKITQCKDCTAQRSELNSGATQLHTLTRPQTKLRSAEPTETILSTVEVTKESELNSGAEMQTPIKLKTKLNNPKMCNTEQQQQEWPLIIWIARRLEPNCVATLHAQIMLRNKLDSQLEPQTNLNTVEPTVWPELNIGAVTRTTPIITLRSAKLNRRAAPMCSRKQQPEI